jgi:signal transduction histidine kinase
MTRDEALESLSSTETNVRLRAARFLAMNAENADRRKLRNALRRETVPWIKRALERSLERVGPAARTMHDGERHSEDSPPRLIAEVRAQVIDEVAGTIIHELSTIVASLKLSAPRDASHYSGSRTETLVNSLASLLSGIRNIKAAASRANYSECDLAQECRDACSIFVDAGDVFRFAGPSPFLVEIDPDLLKLALTNVIRNAVEAVGPAGAVIDRAVTLNWGKAGHEIWVSVLDTGPGFDQPVNSMIEFGKTTKDDHIGFGLGTAKQAMQAMEGDIYPSNAAEGGARVEIRWFGNREDSVR